MSSRRSFLRAAGAAGAVVSAAPRMSLARFLKASQSAAGAPPEEVAKNEFCWREIRMDFKLDRTIINLIDGFTCPTPRVALESEWRYVDMINMAPIFYQGSIADGIQTIRLRVAAEFGCDPEEMALTRRAGKSLQIVQNGIDLKAGDEVSTTEQDYPRMLFTWDQRMRRDNIKVTRLQFPVPTTGDDLYHKFEQAVTPKTKVFHFCHVTNLTAQMFPVARICSLAHPRGIVTHRRWRPCFGTFSFQAEGSRVRRVWVSLHKWLLAPIGNGCLYVRKEMIPRFWPLQATPEVQDHDIRKLRASDASLGYPRGSRGDAGLPSSAHHGAQGGPAAVSHSALGRRPQGSSADQDTNRSERAPSGVGSGGC